MALDDVIIVPGHRRARIRSMDWRLYKALLAAYQGREKGFDKVEVTEIGREHQHENDALPMNCLEVLRRNHLIWAEVTEAEDGEGYIDRYHPVRPEHRLSKLLITDRPERYGRAHRH